ncbi:hypothetical protein GOP47_0021402 [Adiantum capillus-veneris]|uniref:Pentatricopeptide repeat-containing protein n=1 Tax=Adiantum capillus-veneris TaxID=13818 RepID=A0A9D4U7M9_ADICA|nr:hypothetical protein GOP47_0021402 [Adiantum capillus-veneris]
MESEGILPARITYVFIINACNFMQDLAQGMCMHAHIIAAEYASDVVVESSLFTFYGKCGFVCSVEIVFSQISVPNVVAWTVLITSYVGHGHSKEALSCMDTMQEKGLPYKGLMFISCLKLSFIGSLGRG